MTTTNFATSGERASKLAGRSINRERDKPECYRKLRSRSASPTFSTPPKVVVVLPRNFASQPMSSSPSPLRLSPPGPLRLRIKPTWLSARCRTTIISLVWFFFTVDVFLSLSLSRFPPFLKSLDERSLDENERPRRRSSPSLPPSLCQSQGSTPRREGWWDICTEWKIFLRVLVYMPADFSRDSSFDIWPVEKCTGGGVGWLSSW